MSSPHPPPSGNPQDPAFRAFVVERMLRESLSAKAVANEYGLDSRQVSNWKKAYLQKLKTAGKKVGGRPASKRAPRSDAAPMVEDLSRQPVRSEDAQRRKKGAAGKVAPVPRASAVPGPPAQETALPPARPPGTPAPSLSQMAADEPPSGPLSFKESGAEISGDSQDRFSRNWEKMGVSGTILKEAPRPVRLHAHEALWTRLQGLPGVGWLLHGGSFKSAPLALLLFGLVVAGAVVVVLKDAAKYEAGAREASPWETPRHLQPLTYEENLATEALLTRFYEATTIDDLQFIIRAPEVVLPVARRYYVANRFVPQTVAGFEYHRRAEMEGMDVTLHGVMLGSLGEAREVAVEHTAEGPKVDWELAMGYQPMSWQEFRRTRPHETVYFRLSLQPSSYYSRPFHNPEIYRSFRLTYPDELRVINGYAMIDTEAELKLREWLPNDESSERVIVGLAFPRGEHDEELVEITEFLSPSWVMPYEPGASHVDLRINERPALPGPTDVPTPSGLEELPETEPPLELEPEATNQN